MVLDTYVQSHGQSASTWTRVRALFPKREPFSLQVTPRTPFHRLARLVGYGGIDLGYQRADRILFVRSDRPDRARAMLRGTALGTLLLRDPKGKLLVTRPEKRIRKIAGDSVGEVRMLRGGRIVDLAALRSMVQIVMETLDQLAGLGVAGDAPVEEVEL